MKAQFLCYYFLIKSLKKKKEFKCFFLKSDFVLMVVLESGGPCWETVISNGHGRFLHKQTSSDIEHCKLKLEARSPQEALGM